MEEIIARDESPEEVTEYAARQRLVKRAVGMRARWHGAEDKPISGLELDAIMLADEVLSYLCLMDGPVETWHAYYARGLDAFDQR